MQSSGALHLSNFFVILAQVTSIKSQVSSTKRVRESLFALCCCDHIWEIMMNDEPCFLISSHIKKMETVRRRLVHELDSSHRFSVYVYQIMLFTLNAYNF